MRQCSAPMLRRLIRMLMPQQLLILRTHMKMTLCIHQCNRPGRPRRLARCHQASRRRWSRWRRSCHHCPRLRRRRHQHHHRSRQARCRQLPSTSAGATARHWRLQWRKRRQQHLAVRCNGPRQACRSVRGDLRAAEGQMNWTIEELPPGAKQSAGGSFESVRRRCSVYPAPLQWESN